MLGRAQSAKQWLVRAEKLRGDLPVVDAIDEQDLASTRARTLEACGQPREAIDEALAHAQRLPEAFVTGSLNLVVGRCALAIGDEAAARSPSSGPRSPATGTGGCSPTARPPFRSGSWRSRAATAEWSATPSERWRWSTP